jgi:hypothetical protein
MNAVEENLQNMPHIQDTLNISDTQRNMDCKVKVAIPSLNSNLARKAIYQTKTQQILGKFLTLSILNLFVD